MNRLKNMKQKYISLHLGLDRRGGVAGVDGQGLQVEGGGGLLLCNVKEP